MKEKEFKHLVELGHHAQEKMNTYLLYADTMDNYVKQHSAIDPKTDNVVMRMLLDSHRKVILEIITILEETERCINEYETDVDSRIAATSDYVRSLIRFNEQEASDNIDYGKFLTSLYDYNKDSQNKDASTILSGFIQYVIKQR